MKKLLLSAIIMCGSLIAHGAAFVITQGNYIDGSASTQVVAGTNATVSKVLSGATNYYNLPNVAYNTNMWPAIPLVSSLNVTPWRYAAVQCLTGTNLGDTLVVRFAASVDNTHWTSNMFSFTVPSQATFANVATNLDALGFPFWALQSIENKGASNVVGLTLPMVVKATAP